jgi:lipid-binding SYLF domain-containing protein
MTVSRRLVLSAPLALVPAAIAPARADDVLDARHAMEEAGITVDRVREETRKSGELDSLLQDAVGVLVIPSFYKAGFIIGGAFGDGVLCARLPDGTFSDPAFYRMTAGSIGLQIGMQSAAIVFAILTEKGLSAVLNDEFKLGANVGISVGSLGAGAEAATTTHVGQDIVAYSKNAGLFAGGAFEGAVIKPRRDWNAAVYGVGNDDPRAIIQRGALRAAMTLKESLNRNAPPRRPAAVPSPPPASGAYSPPQPETMAPQPSPIAREPLSAPVNGAR